MSFKMSIYARSGRLGLIDGVDQDRSSIGSAVSERRGAPPPAPRVAAPQRTRDNGPMTKSELIQRIAQKQPQLVERDVELAVKMMLDQMAACLAGGGRIEIRGFGSFSLRFRPARVARNPEPGRRCRFRPGTRLISSRGCGCASASIKGSRPLIPRSSPTAGEQCGASAPAAAALDQTRGEAHGRLRRNETLLRGN